MREVLTTKFDESIDDIKSDARKSVTHVGAAFDDIYYNVLDQHSTLYPMINEFERYDDLIKKFISAIESSIRVSSGAANDFASVLRDERISDDLEKSERYAADDLKKLSEASSDYANEMVAVYNALKLTDDVQSLVVNLRASVEHLSELRDAMHRADNAITDYRQELRF